MENLNPGEFISIFLFFSFIYLGVGLLYSMNGGYAIRKRYCCLRDTRWIIITHAVWFIMMLINVVQSIIKDINTNTITMKATSLETLSGLLLLTAVYILVCTVVSLSTPMSVIGVIIGGAGYLITLVISVILVIIALEIASKAKRVRDA